MNIAVTGSSGQIGSYVVEAAHARDHRVIGIDQRASVWTTHVGDIRDTHFCEVALRGCDAIIHCAAQVSVQGSIEDPSFDASTNVLGTISVLEGARKNAVNRIVNVSSAAIYGNPTSIPVTEDHPRRPLAPYGASKLAAEEYVVMYGRLHQLSTVSVRPFNVYSPRQDSTSPYSGVLSRFTDRVVSGEAPIVFGDGSQTRDFIHALDVAQSLVVLAEGSAEGPLNIGTGIETSVRQLAEVFLRAASLDLAIIYQKSQAGEIRRSVADTTRAQQFSLPRSIGVWDGVRGLLKSRANPAHAERHLQD